MFVLNNTPTPITEFGNIRLESVPVHNDSSKMDLILSAFADARSIVLSVEYNTDLFEAGTIRRMLGHFQGLLECGVANPECPIGALEYLTPGERHEILGEWNATSTDYPKTASIPKLFEAQAAQSPGAPALDADGVIVSYGDLNARANRLARYLQRQGAVKEPLIEFVLRTVEESGGNPCPPLIVGVGVGGSAEYAMYLAKKAVTRSVDNPSSDAETAEFEEDLLERVNALGVGPQAVGGLNTAMAVNIETYPTHITALPVGVNLQCHSARLKEAEL